MGRDTGTLPPGAAAAGDGARLDAARVPPATFLERRYPGRFAAAYAALALIASFAVTAFVVTQTRIGRSAPLRWSAWHPDASGTTARLEQIGSYVAARYRLDDGSQMVIAPPNDREYDVIAIAGGSGASTTYQLLTGRSVAYRLCGGGDRCAIATGTASTARALFLSREGLELALYTFRYAPQYASVVVFMPPPLGDTAHYAVLFRRADFARELAEPIDAVLADRVPRPAAFASSPESTYVGAIVGARQYRFGLEDLPGTGKVLLLGPANATG